MTAVFRAAWVIPVDRPPIRGGWVAVDAGRIVAAGGPGDPAPLAGGPAVVECGAVALMPGLVNAHTHLELSWLRGRVPPASSFTRWVLRLMFERRARSHDPEPAVRDAIVEAEAAGTIALADIANTLVSAQPLAESGLSAVIFHELLGFAQRDAAACLAEARRRLAACPAAARLAYRLAPHAPYSTSPELLRAVAEAASDAQPPRTSVHVAESREEIELLGAGTGPWRAVLTTLGAWRPDWSPPGTRPVAYLAGLGVLGPGSLAVHGVHLAESELAWLAEHDVTLVTCPRSNVWVGAGAPPVDRFAASGVRVAVGTDSLASAPDLNLFAELQALRAMAPAVPARTLIGWATRGGAEALGLGGELGTLAPGRRARFLAVDVPADVADVEEYLVSGVTPQAIRWIDGTRAWRGHQLACS
jgi:cytosine/adenosine deaminase-related metal-dependent hydrolase